MNEVPYNYDPPELLPTAVSVALIAQTLQLANDLREAFGQPPLEDLPPSRRADPQRCLLARAFNFDCIVGARVPGNWVAIFQRENEPHAKKLAELANTEAELLTTGVGGSTSVNSWLSAYPDHWMVPIPEFAGSLARYFDAEKLPPEYYER